MSSRKISHSLQTIVELTTPRTPGTRIPAESLQHLDWHEIADVAHAEGLATILFHKIRSYRIQASIPADAFERLQHTYYCNVAHAVYVTDMLLQFLEGLRASGILATVIRGPVLSQLIYNTPFLRIFADVDILIPFDQRRRAFEYLAAEGYTPQFNLTIRELEMLSLFRDSHSFLRTDGALCIDLHWKITSRPWPITTNGESHVFDRLYSIPIQNKPVATLSPTDTLTELLIHGCQHAWDRLALMCDVAHLLKLISENDLREVLEHARSSGLLPAMAASLGLVSRTYRLQAADSLSSIEDKKADAVSKAWSRYNDRASRLNKWRMHLAVLSGPPHRIQWIHWLVFMPTCLEIQAVHLPFSLRYLYYPLRIIRLISRHVRLLALSSRRFFSIRGKRNRRLRPASRRLPSPQNIYLNHLALEALAQGKKITIRVGGKSMLPTIHDGDVVDIKPVDNPNTLNVGQLVLYRTPDGLLRIHRLAETLFAPSGIRAYKVRGDSSSRSAERISPDQILGLVVSHRRTYPVDKR